MIKYHTGYGSGIEEIEVVRETKHSVFFPSGKQARKRGSYDNYWNSWEEAKSFLMEKAELKVNQAQARLDTAKSYYGNVKGLRK